MNCKICNAEYSDSAKFCRQCAVPLEINAEKAGQLLQKKSGLQLKCQRCETSMQYGGLKKFHEGSNGWAFWLGDFGELFINREYFDVYVCPGCGKVELFVDGIGDEKRPDGKRSG